MERSGWKAGERDVKVLVVEDNERILTTIVEGLVAAGYLVSWARNGQEALEEALHRSPDLVITDYEMPGINGIELIRRIRERHPRLPIILMTGSRPALEEGERVGVRILFKPFDLNTFSSLVEEVLRARRRGCLPGSSPF
ncbi:MAG: response regulator [Candidatus Methylomirabilales bacterium]